jgi:acetoacetyl-CoA synthetase
MMWNWLVSALGSGATVVLFDGNPFHPSPDILFDVAERERLTLMGVSAKYIDSLIKVRSRPRDTHDLGALRTLCSTGSPLSDDGFRWVYDAMRPDVHLASISGGTDLCGCFVGGDPTRPVYAGEIQGPALGMAVGVFDDAGTPVTEPGVKGELVCTAPFPSVPVGFWGDDDGRKFRTAYFERFPGVWAHGDFASWTEHGGMVIHGRSDATLNAGGVRIGTAEIYAQVEQLPGVVEAIAVGQEFDHDTRIVLFVRLADGVDLTDELQTSIRTRLREHASPRHVPARIAQVSDLPRTRSNKISELAVADVVNGREVRNTEALANPESLDEYRDRPELRS